MLSLPDFRAKQIVFVFLNSREKISFKNDNLIVKSAEDKIIHQSTCYRLFALYVVGNITVTSGLLQRAEKFSFTLVFMTTSLRVYGVWGSKTEGNFLLRQKQYGYSSLSIALCLIKNKIENQNYLLKRIRNKDDDTKETIKRLENFSARLGKEDIDLNAILGFEGIASREFFKIFFRNCHWVARRPRVKHDPINSLLDTGYTILFHFIEGLLNLYGFDTYKGVYHQCFYQRKSLVCDVVEPFRCIVDARVKKAYSLGEIRGEDFAVVNKQYRLFGKSSQPYLRLLLEAVLHYKEPIFLYVQNYYRCFIREKPIDQYPVFDLSEKQKC